MAATCPARVTKTPRKWRRPRSGDVDDHRNGGAENLLDDGLGRIEQASRRVELDEQRLRLALARDLQRLEYVVGGCRVDPPSMTTRMTVEPPC